MCISLLISLFLIHVVRLSCSGALLMARCLISLPFQNAPAALVYSFCSSCYFVWAFRICFSIFF